MRNLREHEDDIIDVITTGQAFSDAIDTISDKFIYKFLLKKKGNEFMHEMKKISDEMLANTSDDKHRQEILQIYDINILLNNKISKFDLLQKKLLVENFDIVYELVEELIKKQEKDENNG